jgi:hypothetical protein
MDYPAEEGQSAQKELGMARPILLHHARGIAAVCS